MEPMPLALQRAVDIIGGQTALARVLSTPDRPIRQGHVWAWLNRDNGALPPEFVLTVERLTGVSRHDLRPDVFGVAANDGEGADPDVDRIVPVESA